MQWGKLCRLLRYAVIFASAFLATFCILLAFLSESVPLEVLLPLSSVALLAACAASVFTLSFTLLGLALRWLKREG